MRIVSMEKGDDIKSIITRFAKGTEQIQKVLQAEGADFMHSEHLGWILTCPSNLGTGLRAGCMVKVPLFSARPDFKAVCGKMGLQVRYWHYLIKSLYRDWNENRKSNSPSFRPEAAPESTPPPPVAPGTSPTPTDSANPKCSSSTSSSKVSPKSSDGNRPLRLARTLTSRSPRLLFPPSINSLSVPFSSVPVESS